MFPKGMEGEAIVSTSLAVLNSLGLLEALSKL